MESKTIKYMNMKKLIEKFDSLPDWLAIPIAILIHLVLTLAGLGLTYGIGKYIWELFF